MSSIQPMSDKDITIFRLPKLINSRGRVVRTSGRIYYYNGNIYQPDIPLVNDEIGKVKRAIRDFKKDNKTMVENDRKHPEYKNLLELFDLQIKEFGSKW